MPSLNTNTGRMRGRPRRASRTLLEEAAFELFLEQGYAHTTIDEIAMRAGVSRNTFFNYFTAKSDVFWVELDLALSTLPEHLAATDKNLPIVQCIGEAFAETAAELGSGVVPWILTHFDIIGSPDEVMESAFSRLAMHNALLRSFVADRLNTPISDLMPQVLASTTLAAVVSAAQVWAAAGVRREPLEAYLLRALAPIADGFAHIQ